jgi:hypothetical protein
VALLATLALAGAAPCLAGDDAEPPGKITLSVRGGAARPDPAQAGGLAVGTQDAEAAGAAAAAEGGGARRHAEYLQREALGQATAPLTGFGVLTGPLSPTVPSGARR